MIGKRGSVNAKKHTNAAGMMQKRANVTYFSAQSWNNMAQTTAILYGGEPGKRNGG